MFSESLLNLWKQNTMTKQTALSIIAVLWLLSIICGGVAGFYIYPHVYPCNVGSVVVSVTDSTAPNKDTTIAISFKPSKVGVKKYKPSNIDSLKPAYFYVNDTIKEFSPCLDTNLYAFDTISVDNFRATARAIVANNEILNMAIEWRNLKPELWKIKRETIAVEKKQSLVKVYTGIYAGVAIANKTVASYHGGIGLDAIISDRHLIGLHGGLNSSLQPEVGIRFSEKIRLKK